MRSALYCLLFGCVACALLAACSPEAGNASTSESAASESAMSESATSESATSEPAGGWGEAASTPTPGELRQEDETTVAAAAAWPVPDEIERDGPDAELMVQIGDRDNFGFGFPAGFDPFTGRSTPKHGFPFEPDASDAEGTDRIMVVSGWTGARGDGYASTTRRPDNAPRALRVAFDVGDVVVERAALQLFVDDFQSPRWGTRFVAKVNDSELPLLSTMLNALDQTGPIGRLLTIELLPEQLPLLRDGRLEIEVDDPVNDVADGYAFDFVRLLVNPKPWRHAGTVGGIAVDKSTGKPLAGVLASAGNTVVATSGADGRFVLEGVPAGVAVVTGSHPDYQGDTQTENLVAGERIEVRLELEPVGKTGESLGAQLDRQGHVDLYGIYFDTNLAEIKPESTPVLEQVKALLESRPELRLQIAGHTDAEGGDAHNQALSEQRAAAVVAWLAAHGVDGSRLVSEGFGEARPVASNMSAEGRALNRRVEIRRAD